MTLHPKSLAASVQQRLLNLSRERQEAFDLVLTRYALERFLYRLSCSAYSEQFLLKGAMLFAVWGDAPHRPTRDLDFLGFGSSEIPKLEALFREICSQPVEPDGLEFLPRTVAGSRIREDQEYQGVRLKFEARLAAAIIPIQVDIGFGDAVVPNPEVAEYPALLNLPAPRVRIYPVYSVISEKYQAMVWLGMANSRMKDYYDIWILAKKFSFDGQTLARAIQATFERRNTPIPNSPPLALTDAFCGDTAKQRQWQAFVRKNRLMENAPALPDVAWLVASFLLPPTQALSENQPFQAAWPAGGQWQQQRFENRLRGIITIGALIKADLPKPC